MTKKQLTIPAETLSFLKILHPDIKRKIKAGLKEIITNPASGKALKEELEGFKSYKTGRYRIIYRDILSFVEIIAIGERETIYEDMLKLILKTKHQ